MPGRERKHMTKKEIAELMRLNSWTQAELARRVEVTEGAISLWLSGQRPVTGPARVLLREWLTQARAAEESKKQPA